MTFSQKSHEGCLTVDHRGSPGLGEEAARRLGYEPNLVGEGTLAEFTTLGCAHCNTVVIVNPLRTRERGHCFRCNRYVCDHCTAAMCEPDYVHHSIAEIRDLVGSGKYILTGSFRKPVLTPVKGASHG